jgi:hypothetical protein
MMRRRPRFSVLLAMTAVAVLGAAYGCTAGAVSGDDADTGAPPGEDGAADRSVVPGDERPATAPADASADTTTPATDAADAHDATTDAPDDADAHEAGPPPPPPPPPGPLSPTYVDYDVNHVLITGQSNAVANGGTPVLTAVQPFTNLMFDTGVMPMTTCDGNGCKTYQTPNAFVPLVESDQFFNYKVETSANGIADEISHLAVQKYELGARAGYPLKHDVLASMHGRSGNTYWCLRKGFCQYNADRGHLSPFAQGMMEVTSAKAIAAAAGKTHVVRAVVAIHGESDHYAYVDGTPEFPLPGTDGVPNEIKDYSDGLVEWQRDYESSVKAITGQAQSIPLFISAISGWTTTRTSQVAQWQLDAHIRAPGKVVYVTPAYPLSVLNDCLHFDSTGQRRLGEYFAKAYARVVFAGEAWEPVRPKNITRVGNVVTVTYHVPVPPLTLDTVHVSNPGSYGFDFLDNGAMVAVANVAVSAADTVTITLGAVPSGVNMRLRYAQNQDTNPATRCIGPGTVYGGGARGNLRDSDATPSRYGYDLWNWGANFDFPVP